MSTNYPSSLDTWAAKTDNVDTVYSADVNQPNDAAIALETKLGTGASTPSSGKLLHGTGTGSSAWDIDLDTDGTLTANSDTKISSQKAVKTYADTNYAYYGMARQAIMNGNFDVWQRGTSVALADITVAYQADRWLDYVDKNGGTLPTLTRSRQLLTSGDIANAFYFTRLATNGAGTSLGVSSRGELTHKIENGTRNLCGNGKKVTVSFYAKSDITNKRICPVLRQAYGSGGSPTAEEAIKGTPITLTSTWTKYTATFTTNTLVGKTFGTNGDDNLTVAFHYMWGTTFGNTNVQTSVSAETFVGSGNIDIAQVQLCAGDVALPFQPKSFEEELKSCMRYYEKSYDYATAPATATELGCHKSSIFTAWLLSYPVVSYLVKKRTIPTISVYNTQNGSLATLTQQNNASIFISNRTANQSNISSSRFQIFGDGGLDITAFPIGSSALFQWTADAEL